MVSLITSLPALLSELSSPTTTVPEMQSRLAEFPFDILSDIFLAGRCDDPTYGNYWDMSWPIILSHVCYDWRKTALETRRLWTRILFYGVTENRKLQVQMEYLRRSAGAPLDIRVTSIVWETDRSTQSQTMDRVFSLIFPHHARWRRLELPSRYPNQIVKFLRASRSADFPMLETLQVSTTDRVYSEAILLDPRSAPRLSELKLYGTPFKYSDCLFDSLTRLSLYDIRLAEWKPIYVARLILWIFAASPSLRVFKLKAPDTDGSSWPPIDMTLDQSPEAGSVHVLQRLRAFNISDTVAEAVTYLATWIRCPVARSLVPFATKEKEITEAWPPTCLPKLVAHNPFPEVTSFGIRSATPNHQDYAFLWSCLRSMSQLQELALIRVDFATTGGRGMLELGYICPRLSNVNFAMCEGFTYVLLIELLRIREESDSVETLKEVAVNKYISGDRAEKNALEVLSLRTDISFFCWA